MRLSELEACAECFELEGWRDEEKEWLAEQARLHQSQSKVKFRQELIATGLLAQYRALEGNTNVTRAIEESAKLVVMPTLLHQVSRENRALLADVYELKGYSEGQTLEAAKHAIMTLSIIMARRWEPRLNANPFKKAWEPTGPPSLFTSDRLFGIQWKLWKYRITRGGLLSLGGTGSKRSTRTMLASKIGTKVSMKFAGTNERVKAKVIRVDKVVKAGKSFRSSQLTVQMEDTVRVRMTFPWPGVNLAYETDRDIPMIPQILDREALSRYPSVIDNIFRFVGHVDVPITDMNVLDTSSFVSIRSVTKYVDSAPALELAFPGRLINPGAAGAIYREHLASNRPLEQLLREHSRKKRKVR